jgi:hypothetical protein
MGRMAWGYQLMVRMRPNHHLTGDERQTWTLPEPVGVVNLRITDASPAQDTELMFRADGFDSRDAAEATGACLKDWLRLSSALDRLGLDTGGDTGLSVLTDAGKAHLGDQIPLGTVIVPDVHSLVVFEYEPPTQPLRFAMRGRLSVARTSESLRVRVAEVSSTGALSDQQSLACDLVSLVDHETSGRARILALVTAMEVLAERPERKGAIRDLVDKLIDDAMAARAAARLADRATFDPLVSALEDLKLVSISASIRQLARAARPGDAQNAAKLAVRSYGCRSGLIHRGRADIDPTVAAEEVSPLVLDMLRTSLVAGPAYADHRQQPPLGRGAHS